MVVKRGDFVTLPEELLDAAVSAVTKYTSEGYRVKVEPSSPTYPDTPAFVAAANGSQVFGLVVSNLRWSQIARWVPTAVNASRPTRIVVVWAGIGGQLNPEELANFAKAGVGVLAWDGGAVSTVAPPRDLTFSFQFPVVGRRLSRLLKDAREAFDRQDVVESFSKVALRLEEAARAVLLSKVRAQHKFADSQQKTMNYSESRVRRMTLGQVSDALSNLVSPSQTDSRIVETIGLILDTRNRVTHNTTGAITTASRRKYVTGIQIIVSMLEEMGA